MHHLAEGNARQARKRIAADVLVRDEAGRVLLGGKRAVMRQNSLTA